MAYAFRQGVPLYVPFKNGLSVLKSNFDVKIYSDPDAAKRYNPLAKIVKYIPETDEAINLIKCEHCKYWEPDHINLRVYCTNPNFGKRRETSPDEYCSDAEPRPTETNKGDVYD